MNEDKQGFTLCDYEDDEGVPCGNRATVNVQECIVRWSISKRTGQYSRKPEDIENHGSSEHWCDEHDEG